MGVQRSVVHIETSPSDPTRAASMIDSYGTASHRRHRVAWTRAGSHVGSRRSRPVTNWNDRGCLAAPTLGGRRRERVDRPPLLAARSGEKARCYTRRRPRTRSVRRSLRLLREALQSDTGPQVPLPVGAPCRGLRPPGVRPARARRLRRDHRRGRNRQDDAGLDPSSAGSTTRRRQPSSSTRR